MLRDIRHALGLILLVGLYSHAQTIHGASSIDAGPSAIADTRTSTSTSIVTGTSSVRVQTDGTCLSRTINYITHTLPQQCLRTDRAATKVSQKLESAELLNATHITAENLSESGLPSLSSLNTSSTIPNTTGIPNVVATASPKPNSTGHDVHNATEVGVIVLADGESDAESPLDNANFLSFEEWKKQNLAKAGQSPDNVGQDRSQMMASDRRRPGINNALEGLGEESEIDLDFSGFGGVPPPSISSEGQAPTSLDSAEPSTSGPGSMTVRSKDAGKTCKERTNYASFDCAATVLKTNPECKSASSVLVEHKDSYMLNICSAKNKFFIVELCNDILVDTIVLANYEFFSSSFRHFRVSVSDRYPVKLDKWRDLGTFEAQNTREVQAFLVQEPLIWARYLRIEFLSHYGNEYYCPISLLRVHGTTMMQEFRNQEELARGELTDEDPTLEVEMVPVNPIPQEPISLTDETGKSTVQAITQLPTTALPVTLNSSVDVALESSTKPSTVTSPSAPAGINISTTNIELVSIVTPVMSSSTSTSTVSGASGPALPASEGHENHIGETGKVPSPSHTPVALLDSVTSAVSQQPIISAVLSLLNATSNSTSDTVEPPETTSSSSSTAVSHDSQHSSTVVDSSGRSATSTMTNSTAVSPTLQSTASTASSSPPLPQPSTQESFFKSIHKRLQQLESNSTLSLQYIEEQSRILRDAFGKVEKRQLTSTATFLSNLNATVMTELHGFRQAYDQLWQSTVIELESQREQSQRELLALSSRLTLVADELVWQKRMGILQSTLLLLCLGLVLFARPGTGAHLELPLVPHMASNKAALRSSAAAWDSEPNSPSPNESRSPVSLFRRRILRGAIARVSGSRPETRDGLDVKIEPPSSPDVTSQRSASGDSGVNEEDAGVASETQSEPATPNGTYETTKRPPSWPGESVEVGNIKSTTPDPIVDRT